MKLSAYTIAKNCTDLTDVDYGIKEVGNYLDGCRKEGKQPAKTAYIRFYNLSEKRTRLLHEKI